MYEGGWTLDEYLVACVFNMGWPLSIDTGVDDLPMLAS